LETSPVDFLENIEKSGDSGSMDSIFRSCFFGDLDTVIRRLDGSQTHNIEGILIYAEAAHRQGRFDEARMIYDMIINQRERFTLNHWIVANIGLSQILRKEGRYDEAIVLLDSVAQQLDDRVLTSFVKERKALVYVVCHRMKEALDTYRSCIGTFRSRGLNHFLHASYNNRGTLFFRLERYDEAESDWIKGRRCAIKAKSKYGEAAALVNLSDILSMRDETDLAFKYLDRAAKVYSKLNDYEGMSGVEFNLALVHLALRNVERSAHHFERSMTIAKPFPSPMMRKDRTDFYLKRAEELGLKSVKNLI
jgi:tetratricopeptide (TPR) repeat protein